MIVLLALTLAIPALAGSKRRRSKRKRAKARGVLLIGSSSVNGAFGKHIEHDLRDRGFKVHRHGKSSAGLARPDYYDWHQQIRKLPIDKSTRAAVVYLGTNDGQALFLRPGERKKLRVRGKWLRWGDKGWEKTYQARVRRFARALCKAGVPRVAFITPVDTTDRVLLDKLNVIRALQYRGARRSRCAWAFSGRGDRRRLRREKPSAPSSQRLRYKDGFHMTERGAKVAWKRLSRRVVRYVNKPVKRKRLRKRSRRKWRKRVKRTASTKKRTKRRG